jgi:two-component system response regulator FixJ
MKRMEPRINLALVDDDAVFLFEFAQRLAKRGLNVRSFRDGEALLDEIEQGVAFDCVCADVRMPGLSGLDLQNVLVQRDYSLPIILFTGYGEVELAVASMKAGAYDFVAKPIDEARLIASIEAAAKVRRMASLKRRENARVSDRIAELSERQRQVLDLMIKGMTSKQIASSLNINHRTVENYRATVMERIGVGSVAQLVRVVMDLERDR